MPVEVSAKGTTRFATDEHVRKDPTAEDMAKLKAVFKKDGTVTAGNASGINDGARGGRPHGRARRNGRAEAAGAPRRRTRTRASSPQVMGIGPIPAVRRVFEKAGLKPADMDVIESNEAFAVQAMAVTQDLGLDPAKVNPERRRGSRSATRSAPPARSSR